MKIGNQGRRNDEQRSCSCAACHISPSTVSSYLERAAEAGLTWTDAAPLTEAEVKDRLFTYVGRSEPKARYAIDFDWIHSELPRTGVTLQLLWGEYQLAAREAGVVPYPYSLFCELVRWLAEPTAASNPLEPEFTGRDKLKR